MFQRVEQRLNRLSRTGDEAQLRGSLIGLEKESLRVSAAGDISQKPHPAALGSALTHPYITTDYSEALLECITPALPDKAAVLDFLRDIHTFIYSRLENEFIWATSMPCVLHGESSIPIAQYGHSNRGRMKTVYRNGLGYRYGRIMQVIAGVHFNYSFSEGFFKVYQDSEGERGDAVAFRSARYFDMIRNLQRFGWLIPYLFGASPAVCKSFLAGKHTDLQELSGSTYYGPFATSLRMGDIGYQNNKERCAGIKVNYESLQSYVDSLQFATSARCKDYEKIGVKVDGEYRQLNANLLQIENEYYSTVRPKQMVDAFEKPSLALKRRGVQYVELRSLDVNVFDPLGIQEDQLYFLEALMLFCLLADSPVIGEQEQDEINLNQNLAAHQGRDPELEIHLLGQWKKLSGWSVDILRAMEGVGGLLDSVHETNRYSAVINRLRHAAADPDTTPSARMLREMRANGESFFQFAYRKSKEHQAYFQSMQLAPATLEKFTQHAAKSIAEQKAIEARDEIGFEEYLARYFAQT